MPLPQTNINAFTGMNAPTRSDPDNFDGRAEDAWNRLKSSQAQFNTLAGQVNDMATAANASATNAATSAALADQDRIDAQQARTDAQTARTQAQGYRNEAEGFKNTALTAVDSLTATSTTSNVIGAGSKTWTGTGLAAKSFKVGQRLRAVNPANVAQWMEGQVTAYTNNGASSSITIGVSGVDLNSATSGNTVANWSFTIAGERGSKGDTGGLSGGNATGAINVRRANGVPIASGVADVWSGAGNFMVLNGPGTVTDFPDAPQAGSARTVYVSGATTIQSGARILVYGGTQTLSTGDLLDIEALEVNVFLVTVRKRDGTPVAHDRGALHNLRVFGGSGVFPAPKTGWYKITVIGSSGSGGAAVSSLGGYAGASGAGAGGFVSGMRFLTAGVNYAVGVFAGGAAVSASSSSFAAANGNAGGNNFFSGAGITTMTANGGGGGLASNAPGAELAGGVGGTASGAAGDMIVQGGSGGTVRALMADSPAASGGGAVGLRGQPYRGGDASANGGLIAAGGGAGVGGRGGDAISTTTGTRTGGGGSAGPAADLTNAVATESQAGWNFQGTNGGGASYPMPNDLESATGGGGGANATGNVSGYSGGGGGGSNSRTVPNDGGLFAGGGGTAARTSEGAGYPAGKGGGYGGAPGGVAQINSASTGGITAIGQAGRAGGVWIEW